MTVKTVNYSPVQEAAILAAIVANGNVANLTVAKALAARDDMKAADGTLRQPRAIVAKITTMARDKSLGISYSRQEPVSKSGNPVQKKLDLVNRIAASAGVAAEKLDGLDKAPKGTVEFIAACFAELAERRSA